MTFERLMYLACVPCLLGACGGDRAENGATPGPRSTETSPTERGVTAAPPAAGEARVPAFVTGSAPTVDSAASSDSSAAIRSVYTSLAEADCRLVEQHDETGDTTSRCPGTTGYALLVHDWDARMTVDVVAPGGRTHRLRYSGVITNNFSSLGPRAEWRMRNGRPIALIVRVNAFENPEVPNRATSYLAVTRITDREVCVTDRIPPSATANEAARQAGDRSAARPCMRDLGS
jgi:hypothetical protein